MRVDYLSVLTNERGVFSVLTNESGLFKCFDQCEGVFSVLTNERLLLPGDRSSASGHV